jgi:hypothetical protein
MLSPFYPFLPSIVPNFTLFNRCKSAVISPPRIETTQHGTLLYAREQEKNRRYWYDGKEAFIAPGML